MNSADRVRDRRTENRHFIDNVILDKYGAKIGPFGLAVYMALCRFADLDDQDCFPSQETIAKRTGMARSTVNKHLKQLAKLRLIRCERRAREDGGQTSNIYYLLDPPVAETDTPCRRDGHPPVAETDTNNPHVEQSSANKNGGKAAPPPAVAVFRENAHRFPAKSWYEEVDQVVGREPQALELWGQIVKAYVGNGWNPVNVRNMLDFYQRREIPSTRGGRNGTGQGCSRTLAQRGQGEHEDTPTEEETLAFQRAYARKHAEQGVVNSPYYEVLTDEERAELGIGL